MFPRPREVHSRIIPAVVKSFATASLVVVAAVVVPTGSAWAATPIPTGAILPLPLAAGPVPNAIAASVDCVTAGSCTGVGSYQDNIGITHAMAEDLRTGTWTASPILAPVDAPDYTFSDLNSVSCVSAGNCIGVGDYRVSTIKAEGFYAVETSGVWARGLVLPVPADAQSTPAQTAFDSASCVPGGNTCKLLGEYVTNNIPAAIHSVVDTYVFGTGITGPPVEFSQLSGQDGIELNSISCTTSSDCVAVGSQTHSFASEATYVTESAGTMGHSNRSYESERRDGAV